MSKIFAKIQRDSEDIYCPYIRVSTLGHVQNNGLIPPKPFLFKCKFEQLYITNFLPGASNFVGMIITPNDDTTPSGASRGDD